MNLYHSCHKFIHPQFISTLHYLYCKKLEWVYISNYFISLFDHSVILGGHIQLAVFCSDPKSCAIVTGFHSAVLQMAILAYISWLKTKKALKLMHVLWARDTVHPGSWTVGTSVFPSGIILSAQFCWAELCKMLSVGTDHLLSICATSLKCMKYSECIAVRYRLGAPGQLYVCLFKCVSRAATRQTQHT